MGECACLLLLLLLIGLVNRELGTPAMCAHDSTSCRLMTGAHNSCVDLDASQFCSMSSQLRSSRRGMLAPALVGVMALPRFLTSCAHV